MVEQIIIQIQEQSSNPLNWIELDQEGLEISRGQNPWSDLAELSQGWQNHALFIMVPGSQCLFIEAHIPAKSPRQIRAALPYSVEEQLAQNVETLHFAIGEQNEKGNSIALAVDKPLMSEWLKYFDKAEITPKQMTADYLCVPAIADSCHVIVEEQTARVRFSDGRGFSCDVDLLDMLLQNEVLQQNDDSHDDKSHEDKSSEEKIKPKLLLQTTDELGEEQMQNLQQDWEVQQIILDDAFIFLARNINSKNAINLMQASFIRKPRSSKTWLTWRLPAIAASIVVALQLVTWGIDYWRLSQQKNAIKTAQLTIYKKAFPAEKRINNPVRLMRSRLKALGSSSTENHFLPLLEKFSQAAIAIETTQLTSLSYKAKKGEINIDYIAPDLATIERFQNELKALNLEVKPGASNAAGESYTGRMTIKEKS